MSPNTQPLKWLSAIVLTYDFDCLEFSIEPGIIAKLTPAYTAASEVLWETTDSGDERGLTAFAAARSSVWLRARCIVCNTIPERPG